jgi:hypothetical protein
MYNIVPPLSLSCNVKLMDDDARTVYVLSLIIFGMAWVVTIALWVYRIVQYHSQASLTGRPSLPLQLQVRAKELNDTAGALVLFTLQVGLYVALLLGQGSSYIEQDDLCVPWVRWAVYSISCSLLASKIATLSQFSLGVDRDTFVTLITLTLLTGAFSAASTASEEARWTWFGVGFVPYLPAMFLLLKNRSVPNLVAFVFITWSLYPVIYLLGPAMTGVTNLAVESILYLVADVFTKILFEAWIMGLLPCCFS